MNITFILFNLILALSILIFPSGATADIILPRGTVKQCITISNLDDFPDIVLLARISKPKRLKLVTYQIKPGQCLHTGRKGSQTKIYWTTKVIMDSLKEEDVNDLIKRKDPRIHFLNISIPTWEDYMDPKKSIRSREEVYFLKYDCQHKLVLNKLKEVIKHSNGLPDKVIISDKPSDNSNKQ